MGVFARLVVCFFVFIDMSKMAYANSEVSFDVGFRQDDFHWNIASDLSGASTPNILSELSWRDLQSFVVGLSAENYQPDKVYLSVNFQYGLIYKGDNQDSDYFGNDRTQEFSRSNNDASKGHTMNTEFALGYVIGGAPKRGVSSMAMIPMLGYAYNTQNLIIREGVQTIPANGPFPGLNSTYDSLWKGAFTGVKLQYDSGKRFRIFASYRYYKAHYNAQANWNLRSDFQHPVSFRHSADGHGQMGKVGVRFTPKDNHIFTLSYSHQVWKTDPGLDTTYFANGSTFTLRLNEVVLESDIFLLSYLYKY